MSLVPADSILSVEDLSVTYGNGDARVHAVNGVTFDVPRGAAVGLVGESGSGKTTVGLSILRLLGSRTATTRGRIRFRDTDLMRISEAELRELRGNRISTVFQDPLTSLTPSLAVGEQIAETMRVHGKSQGRDAWHRTIALLDLVGLPDPAGRARQYPHQLSGGMRQRVAIAMAIACDPDLVILDEPTTALDVTIQAQILDLLDRLRHELHMSMLLITHDLGVVAEVCDHVAVLYAGQLVETGATAEVFRAPRHPYTKGLLACLPRIVAAGIGRQRLPHVPGRVPDLSAVSTGCVFAARCCFAEARCATEPQVLSPAGPGRHVACWKWEPLADENWRMGGAAVESAARASAPGDLAMVRVGKQYPLSGFWDSFRARRGPGGLPTLEWVPRTLQAVDDVSLRIGAAETVALVGESGCGKSTLGLMVVGLVQASRGRVELDGLLRDTGASAGERQARRKVQIIFQNPDSSLNPRKTVGAIIGRPLALYGLRPRAEIPERVHELLVAVQLAPAYAERYPHQLSGGEKQRVGIARALAAEPDFIVCDEPITALDLSVRASILNLLDDLKRQLGLSLLFIAHDLAVVRHIADRVAVMYRGRICESGTTGQVFEPPYHPYTWALLSAIPSGLAVGRRERIRLRGSATDARTERHGCVFSDRCPVRIGEICDDLAPPEVEVARGHVIACHHPAEFLLELALPTVGAAATEPSLQPAGPPARA